MIISHRHKFIFIKTRKTAGTSIEMALASICGPDDVLTPDHVHVTEKDALAATARNWQQRFNPARELMQARSPMDVARTLRDAVKRPRFYNHMRASSVMARVPKWQWDSYYKFCFERNSWDKMISFFHWKYRFPRSKAPDFAEYLADRGNQTLDQHYGSDWERYTLHDKVIVDRVCNFGDLEGELKSALTEAGVPSEEVARIELPKLKTNIRPNANKIRYTPETAAKVEEIFEHEIKEFNYELPKKLVDA